MGAHSLAPGGPGDCAGVLGPAPTCGSRDTKSSVANHGGREPKIRELAIRQKTSWLALLLGGRVDPPSTHLDKAPFGEESGHH